jgi:rubrerythrin
MTRSTQEVKNINQGERDLMKAFARESHANRKYLAFARRAEEKGQEGVVKPFRAAAAAERVHARTHLG